MTIQIDAWHNVSPRIISCILFLYMYNGILYHAMYTQFAKMTHLKVYENYVEKLVKCLPMDDATFIKRLSAERLLPGDTESKIKTLHAQSDKASYFLNHVIKPAMEIDNFSDFKKLLLIMQNCDYAHVQQLSCEIEQDINDYPRKGN